MADKSFTSHFVQGWGKSLFLRKWAQGWGGPLCTPDVTSTPSFLQFLLEVPKCWLLQKGLPRLWGTQRPGAQEGNETLSELVSVLSFMYVVERVFPKHPV